MSGGHGHDQHAHGHAPESAHDEGPAEFPPLPETRWISPARADFEKPFPGSSLLWPVFWLCVVAAGWAATSAYPGKMGGGHEDHGANGAHESAPEHAR